MVTLQVTAAVLLLMGAGLYLRMTEEALDRYVVFDTTPLATALVDLRLHGYHESRGRAFLNAALHDVRSLPGVEHAALADGFPGGAYAATRPVLVVTNKEFRSTDGTVRRLDGSQRKPPRATRAYLPVFSTPSPFRYAKVAISPQRTTTALRSSR